MSPRAEARARTIANSLKCMRLAHRDPVETMPSGRRVASAGHSVKPDNAGYGAPPPRDHACCASRDHRTRVSDRVFSRQAGSQHSSALPAYMTEGPPPIWIAHGGAQSASSSRLAPGFHQGIDVKGDAGLATYGDRNPQSHEFLFPLTPSVPPSFTAVDSAPKPFMGSGMARLRLRERSRGLLDIGGIIHGASSIRCLRVIVAPWMTQRAGICPDLDQGRCAHGPMDRRTAMMRCAGSTPEERGEAVGCFVKGAPATPLSMEGRGERSLLAALAPVTAPR